MSKMTPKRCIHQAYQTGSWKLLTTVPHSAPFETEAKMFRKLKYADGDVSVVPETTTVFGPVPVGVCVMVEPLPLHKLPDTVVTGQYESWTPLAKMVHSPQFG